MKKLLAILLAAAMLAAFASCDTEPGETGSESEEDVSIASIEQVSVDITPVSIPSIPSVPDVVESKNLALKGTLVDMNTGLAEGDEGYVGYYNDGGLLFTLERAADGDMTTGWQVATDEGESVSRDVHDADPDAYPDDLWYDAPLDDDYHKRQTFEDGKVWVGVEFEEATAVDTIAINLESGSLPFTVEQGGYYIQYKDAEGKWNTIEATPVREENASYTDCVTDTVTFEEAIEVCGVRLVLVKCETKYAPKVWEIEVYGPEAEETPDESAEENTDDTTAE